MFPDILSEIAGGPALITLGLHETGEDLTMEFLDSGERFEPCLPFVCAPSSEMKIGPVWRKGAGSSSAVREIRMFIG